MALMTAAPSVFWAIEPQRHPTRPPAIHATISCGTAPMCCSTWRNPRRFRLSLLTKTEHHERDRDVHRRQRYERRERDQDPHEGEEQAHRRLARGAQTSGGLKQDHRRVQDRDRLPDDRTD